MKKKACPDRTERRGGGERIGEKQPAGKAKLAYAKKGQKRLAVIKEGGGRRIREEGGEQEKKSSRTQVGD